MDKRLKSPLNRLAIKFQSKALQQRTEHEQLVQSYRHHFAMRNYTRSTVMITFSLKTILSSSYGSRFNGYRSVLSHVSDLFISNGSHTVSYTHLDVYKRQI